MLEAPWWCIILYFLLANCDGIPGFTIRVTEAKYNLGLYWDGRIIGEWEGVYLETLKRQDIVCIVVGCTGLGKCWSNRDFSTINSICKVLYIPWLEVTFYQQNLFQESTFNLKHNTTTLLLSHNATCFYYYYCKSMSRSDQRNILFSSGDSDPNSRARYYCNKWFENKGHTILIT